MDEIRNRYITDSVTFRETSSPRYHDRTVINARESDLTVAFAVDFRTAGERLTRTAAGERYLAVNLPATPAGFHDGDIIRRAAELIAHRTESQGPIRMNIAGNGLETLSRIGVTQDDADAFIADVLGRAMSMGLRLSEVMSGGQSGIDEAGTKAAVAYGLPATVTCPRGYLFNDDHGHPHWNRDSFVSRFNDIPFRRIPSDEFDVREAMSPHVPSEESRSYRPSRDSMMLGAVAGDIIGSPYFFADVGNEGFDLFAPTRSGSRQGAVNHHPSPTNNTTLTLAVARWLLDDASHSEEGLRKAVSAYDPRHLTSNNIAVAASVAGVYADGIREAVDLSRIVVRACGRNPEKERFVEAAAVAVYMASHGRDRHEIAFAMEMDYGFDPSVARAGMHAARLLSQGYDEDAISKVMLQEHGVRLGRERGVDADGETVYTLQEILPRTREMEEHTVEVNGEPFSWMEPSYRRDTLSEHSLPLAVASFMDSFTYEETIRKAIMVGGDSPAIAAMAGALAAAYFGGVPDAIASRCELYLGTSLSDSMQRFLERDLPAPQAPERETAPHIDVHVFYGEPFAVIRRSDKDLLKAAAEEGIHVVSRKELSEMMEKASDNEKTSRLDGHYQGMQRLYLTVKGLEDVSHADIPGLPPLEERRKSRLIYDDLERWCRDARVTLEKRSGFTDPRSEMLGGTFRFTSAYYPVTMADRIEVREGDLLAGAVGIDQSTGLLRVQWSGDYRDGDYREADWCRERVFEPSRIVTRPYSGESLSEDWRRSLKADGIHYSSEDLKSLYHLRKASSCYTEDLDGLKNAIARFCLDVGVGQDDLQRGSNLERANADVAALMGAMEHIRNTSSKDDISMHGARTDALFNALSAWREDFRLVRKDGLYNLQDREGGYLLKRWYPEVTDFSGGFARVRTEEGLWNYVDHDGIALLNHGVEKACAFTEGLAAVCRDGKWNYIGKDGVTIGRRWYESAGPFVDGRATVCYQGRHARIDRDGNMQNSKDRRRGI